MWSGHGGVPLVKGTETIYLGVARNALTQATEVSPS